MDISNNNYTETLVFFHVIGSYALTEKYKSVYFSNKTLQTLFELVKPHIMQYQEEPTEEQVCMIAQRENKLTTTTKDVIHSLWQIRAQLSQYSKDWLDDCSKSYAEWNNFVYGVQKLSSFLISTQSDVTVESCHEYVQKVKSMFVEDTSFHFNDSLGHDFFDPAEHQSAKKYRVSTGWPFIDKCLGGGTCPGEIYVYAGSAKSGKSMFLCSSAALAIQMPTERSKFTQGQNVLYVSLEMSVDIVSRRIGSNLFNIPYNDYDRYVEDPTVLQQRMKTFFDNSFVKPGALIIEQFPTSSLTPQELEAFIMNIESAKSTEEDPFKFAVVYVDYLNIMKSGRPGMNSAETYMKIKSIIEDLRAICIRRQLAMYTVTQLGRMAVNASDVDATQVAESQGVIVTADFLGAILASPQMRVESCFYVKPLATRNSDQMGNRKRFEFSQTYMKVSENLEEDIIQEGMPLPDQFMTDDANTYQKITHANNYRYNSSQKHNNGGQQQQPVQQPVQPAAPTTSLGATELKISGYDLFQ